MTSVALPAGDHRFNGSRIVEVYWRGAKVLTVEGQFVYRLSESARSKRAMPTAATLESTAVRGASRSNDRGIGVLFSDPDLLERDSGADSLHAPEFDWIEPVVIDYGCAVNDPRRHEQWGLDMIDADGAWPLQESNGTVVLAVLDSGLPVQSSAASHEDLNDNRFNLGPNLVAAGLPIDDHGHGTHVAGIAAAKRDNALGVAGLWEGTVYIIKVLDQNKAGTSVAFNNGVRDAIEFATSKNARLVVNYSAAGGDSKTKRDAVTQLKEYGALLVAAVGNGNGGDVEFPAAYAGEEQNVVAVSAVDGSRNRASFSNRGLEVTVSAPGVGIVSTLPDYAVTLTQNGKNQNYDSLDGTSQASPAVAAVAAMVWAKYPHLTAAEVRAKIASSATAVSGADSRDVGAGILNARAALL